ncbi:MAG: (2Fe-2S)-binding protein [Rhodospirillales bacterium]|nr:MAG: (2Fe-2S)-binding protein [Rhodospirillales bacterium]
MEITIRVNGQERTASVPPETTLLTMLRANLGLTGAKLGCDVGDCGACSVLVDGEPVNACLMLAAQAAGRDVLTIEGLGDFQELSPLQEMFELFSSFQCGFCAPGMIISAKALLDKTPNPTAAEVREALSGNLCRCTGYTKIIDAVMEMASRGAAESERA